MRILMLTPYLPYPPASGGQIRTYNLLKHLSKSHEVHLVCLYKRDEEKQHAAQLNQYCKKVYLCRRPEKPWQIKTILRAIFGKLPFLIVRNYSSEAAKTVKELLSTHTFDVIHAETFYVMPHIPETKIPILLVEQTIEYRVYKHYIESRPWFIHHPLRLDTYKLKYWERFYWQKASLVAAVSESDALAISFLAPEVTPVVIPNGAGDDMFEMATRRHEDNTIATAPHLLFLGNYSWLQNIEASDVLIDAIYPELIRQLPQAKLIIAGQNIPTRYKALMSDTISIVDLMHADTEVVKELYSQSHMFVAPIHGPGGTRLKILAAMASRTPIITTATGAEGLSLVDGESYLRAETAADFVKQIKRLAHDANLHTTLTTNAFKLAKEKYSWESITKDLIRTYHQLTAQAN